MKTPTTKLVIDCCKALVAREKNAGSWPMGEIPDCFFEYRKTVLPFVPDDDMYTWLHVTISSVKDAAVRMIVNFSDVVEPPKMLTFEKWHQDHEPVPMGRVCEQLEEIPVGKWGSVGMLGSNPRGPDKGPGIAVKRITQDNFILGTFKEKLTIQEAARHVMQLLPKP